MDTFDESLKRLDDIGKTIDRMAEMTILEFADFWENIHPVVRYALTPHMNETRARNQHQYREKIGREIQLRKETKSD